MPKNRQWKGYCGIPKTLRKTTFHISSIRGNMIEYNMYRI